MIGGLSAFATQATVPSLPEIQSHFGATVAATQTIVSTGYMGLAVGYLLAGPLSDRLGRRRMTLAGLAAFLAGCLLATLAPTLGVLVAARALQAIGIGAAAAVSRAAISDHFRADRASTAIAQTATAALVAPFIAPAIGGIATDWFGWWMPFALTGALGLGATLYTSRVARDSRHRTAAPDISLAGAYAELLRDARFRGYALYGSFMLVGLSAFVSGAPHMLREHLGLSASDYGLLATLPAFAVWMGAAVASRIALRLGPARLMTLGTGIALAGGLLMTLVIASGWREPLAFFGAASLVAFSHSIGIPGAVAGALALRPGLAGTASGLMGFLQLGFAALWVQAVGFFAHGSVWPLAVAIMAAGVLSALCLARLRQLNAL